MVFNFSFLLLSRCELSFVFLIYFAEEEVLS